MENINIDSMKEYIRRNNLLHLTAELIDAGWDGEAAIEYVYDGHALSKEDFVKKYFG